MAYRGIGVLAARCFSLLSCRSLGLAPRALPSSSRQSWELYRPTYVGSGVLWHRLCSDEASADVPKYDTEYFENLVKGKPVVLFMKGSPEAPMCGFSKLVVRILQMHGLESYVHYDVLQDVDFKEGMKKFSNWPTFPQVYLQGELLGGSDIMLQMHQSGDLAQEFEKIGHKSTLSDVDEKQH